ncbi:MULTISPECIES: DEAD/DEAH box helicase [Enterococcus]|uniref:Helicase n=1 Tax=Candidatus Enterococcus mangumiae TaxID=2230878 RepID=A0ABZ2SW08_9ENTE|nr:MULTISPECIES: DEAD/DEAH box helicase family protein [unclassified Enterococcus]MBO0489079.1 DEAD/DEAH box helicase family protein [Enterococcus sp. DIV1094]MBO1298482.1 DEAD/DEAH box helicase family protein [Enterococcus sp. DIV1271a]
MDCLFDIPVNIENNNKLRKPQIEAYMAAKSFFSDENNKEALVVLPTGTGKSGLIAISPFGVAKKRVLVITPGIVTKASVIKTLHPLDKNFWLTYDVIFNPKNLPAIEEYTSDMLDSSLNKLDIVVTNVQQLNQSNSNSLINRVDNDFFDLIIVDEAHHSVADSWKKALAYFNDAKVLHVTGTPYRGDHQELPGKEIHNTPLSEVMALKYVKGLRKKTINSSQLFFTIPESDIPLTKEEVLVLKEKEWVERSISLSESCSKEVIGETINQLNEIKTISTKVPHKILAIACSIKHAEDLKNWYEEKGMSAEIVHSDMKPDSLEKAFQRIESHQCNVVVSVNMLMEGYDHKYLTVLGLFRPYRSKNAFAQVVGRVLRSIPDSEIVNFDIDNNAVVVFHEEIGLNSMWEDFSSEVEKSKKIPVKEYTVSDREYVQREILYANVTVDDHYLSDEDSYLKEVDFNKLFEEARNKTKQEKETRRKQLEGLGIPDNQIEAMLSGLEKEITEKSSLEIDELLITKRPEDVRRRTREFLFKNANETAAALLFEYGIPEQGNELVPVFNRFFSGALTVSDKNNGIIVRFINSKLSRKFGPVKNREPETLLASKEYAQNQLVPEIRRLLDNVR